MTTALPTHARRATAALALALTTALLAACAGTPGDATSADPTPEATTAAPVERATATPRLTVTHEGGVLVLDATSLEVVADLPAAGYLRVNPAGDGRHVMVSTSEGFQLLDSGTWGEPHGDHAHHYTADPQLTDITFPATKPGHVVVHDGRTALFADGTGDVTVLDAAHVGDGPSDDARTYTTPSAHHGVAVELHDGTLVVSEGTQDARTGVRALDADDTEIAATDACPGVHGESVAADDVVAIGCEDGVVLYREGAFTKVQSPDAYGRIGNQAGSEASAIVLGDYKSDPDAELERPTRISLVDTRTATLRLVDLPASYTFRSLARGDDGEALVLGTDGALHVIDAESGTLVRSMPVVAAWEEPADWQVARPGVKVHAGTAYVTDPAARAIHAVDIQTGEVYRSVTLDVVPDEVAIATGEGDTHAH
ncbi:zinc metallochaperone AztD [Cellulomonas sp. S1-8]|uniref:zinc metallochaperone AztD n=1 Tax=Cellulomonas sp. S1-8 TaxID=2904790 RepID=UPI0022443E45|nr:zinc metallochaperone AztD [Cellulomonas sp. S1-8]UZN03536.1 zinc metallochaperone AztD [Cellulomonas sp. S1-8]